MDKKTVWWIVGGVAVLAVVIFLLASAPGGNFGPGSSQDNALSPNGTGPNGSQSGTQGKTDNSATGRVVFTMSDPTVSLSSVSAINIKTGKIEIHNAFAKDSTTGWTTVSSEEKTYDLLAMDMKNQTKLVADLDMSVGSYDQIIFMVDGVTVTTKTGKTVPAILPSQEIIVSGNFVVKNATSNINFAMNAGASLFVAQGGEYIFAPVLKISTKNQVAVSVKADGTATVTGGSLNSVISAGMDIDGNTRLNFALDPKSVLKVEGNIIKTGVSI